MVLITFVSRCLQRVHTFYRDHRENPDKKTMEITLFGVSVNLASTITEAADVALDPHKSLCDHCRDPIDFVLNTKPS